MSTTLKFADDGEFKLSQFAASATVGYALPSRWSFRAAVGTIIDGEISAGQRTDDISAGITGGVGVSKLWPLRRNYFVTGSVDLSASRVTTHQGFEPGVSFIATDLRVGAVVGKTLGRFSPFLATRVFGGPVFWTYNGNDITGTDIYKFQVGGGLSVMAGKGLSVMANVSVLGEQAASISFAQQM